MPRDTKNPKSECPDVIPGIAESFEDVMRAVVKPTPDKNATPPNARTK